MNTTVRRRIVIYLCLTLLFTTACLGCYSIPGTERISGDVKCVSDGYNLDVKTTSYTCYCPMDPKYTNPFDITSEDFADPDRIKSNACYDYYIRNPVIPSFQEIPATEAPTEEPAPTEAPTDPAPLKPFLTGNFTTCDNEARYVNFSIAEDAPPYDPATFKLLFNGYEAKCAPAANNPGILTCNYPPVSYDPPAGIQVFIGEELVNEFDFNGGKICDPAPQPNTDTEATEEPNNPAPTEEPTPDTGGD